MPDLAPTTYSPPAPSGHGTSRRAVSRTTRSISSTIRLCRGSRCPRLLPSPESAPIPIGAAPIPIGAAPIPIGAAPIRVRAKAGGEGKARGEGRARAGLALHSVARAARFPLYTGQETDCLLCACADGQWARLWHWDDQARTLIHARRQATHHVRMRLSERDRTRGITPHTLLALVDAMDADALFAMLALSHKLAQNEIAAPLSRASDFDPAPPRKSGAKKAGAKSHRRKPLCRTRGGFRGGEFPPGGESPPYRRADASGAM